MITIENLKIRINKDISSVSHLVGWGECLVVDADEDFRFWVNNWTIKAKYGEDGSLKVYIEFPYKTVGKDGETKKVFYCKPVNASTYGKFESEVLKYIKENAKKGGE